MKVICTNDEGTSGMLVKGQEYEVVVCVHDGYRVMFNNPPGKFVPDNGYILMPNYKDALGCRINYPFIWSFHRFEVLLGKEDKHEETG
jgi:hypothetical protein